MPPPASHTPTSTYMSEKGRSLMYDLPTLNSAADRARLSFLLTAASLCSREHIKALVCALGLYGITDA